MPSKKRFKVLNTLWDCLEDELNRLSDYDVVSINQDAREYYEKHVRVVLERRDINDTI